MTAADRARVILAVPAAMVSTLAIYAGGVPDRLLTSLHGTSLSAVIVFVALIACGLWVLRTASASARRWAAGIGGVLASAQLAGLWLRNLGVAGQSVLQSADFAWNAVHWLGIFWMVTGGLAALISALDAHDLRSGPDGASEPERGPRLAARMVASLRATDRSRRGKTVLAVFGILVVSRVPYLLVYWPGLVFFDTFRSYAYARGTSPWQTYEPVGNSLLVALMQWLGTALGWGDAGGVAIGSITGIVAGSAAFTFMLVRIAVWRVHPGVWAAAFAWAVLLPVFGFLSIEVVKDVPFSIALTVFLVCVGEVSLGGRETAKKLWPWLTMTGAGLFVLVTRNNGIHVLLLSLPVLLVVLRHAWKRMLVVVATLAVGFMIYVGPVYGALDVRPGPSEEAYSVPIQQPALISKLHSAALAPSDREFITRTFAGVPPEELGNHYVPWLADPMKLQARKAWADHSTAEFLLGWARLVLKYPVTAIEATLANSAGYWDPEGASYDGLLRWSFNDIRGIHLGIPSGPPASGVAAKIEASGIMPTWTYRGGLHDDGYRAIPLLGLAMSPGPVCWLWLITGLLVARRRDPTALAVFVPAGMLLLTCLAGPVSGGQRYALPFFMALPLAVTAVALAVPRCCDRRLAEPQRAGRSSDVG